MEECGRTGIGEDRQGEIVSRPCKPLVRRFLYRPATLVSESYALTEKLEGVR